MDSSPSQSSPQPKRHSFPAILTYSETLSVLSEHQRQDVTRRRRSDTPTLNGKGSDEKRRENIQQAMEWLVKELKDMHHQDKFLLRQFNHLNRSIQDLKEKQEMGETKENQQQPMKGQLKQDQPKQEQLKKDQLKKEELKQELLKQDQPKKEQLKKEQLKQDQLKKEELKQEQGSLNEYDSDYGSDQSMDKFEEDYQLLKNNYITVASPKVESKQRTTKRWTWWK